MLLCNGGDWYFSRLYAAIQCHARMHPKRYKTPTDFLSLRDILQACSPGHMNTRGFSQKIFLSLTILLHQFCAARVNQTTQQLCIHHHLKSTNRHITFCFFYTSLNQKDPHQSNPTPYKHHTRTNT